MKLYKSSELRVGATYQVRKNAGGQDVSDDTGGIWKIKGFNEHGSPLGVKDEYPDDHNGTPLALEAQWVLVCDPRAEPAPVTRATVLDDAREAVLVDRAASHGDVEDNFRKIAKIWSARVGVEITPVQISIMMIDLKAVRAWGNPGHADNWVDIAGYAACGGEISDGAK